MCEFREYINLLNEEIASTEVQSSHIKTVEHTGQDLYITFLNGSIYEYDNVPENMVSDMLRQDSKGKFFWKWIRDPGKPGGDFSFRKVLKVPESKKRVRWNWKTSSWEDANVHQNKLNKSIIPVGYTINTYDGDQYIWYGAQWGSKKTGRVATKGASTYLTNRAAKELKK